MNRLIVVIAALLITIPATSQLNFGVKAGMSTNNLNLDQTFQTVDGDLVLESLGDATYGFHGGLFLRLTVLGVYLQPEVLLSTVENQIKITKPGETVSEIKGQRFNKLDIPVMVGFKVGFLRINAGPAATILLESPKDLLDSDNYEDIYKAATFGYQAGLGVDLFKKVTLDLRYEGNLNKFRDEIEFGGEAFQLDQRSGSILLSAGFIF